MKRILLASIPLGLALLLLAHVPGCGNAGPSEDVGAVGAEGVGDQGQPGAEKVTVEVKGGIRVITLAMPRGVLCVTQKEYGEGPSRWTFQPTGADEASLVGEDLAAMSEVDDLLPSPDLERLAVLSVGEGHPIIEVIDLPELLTRHKVVVYHAVDPYPGIIALDRWEDGKLIVWSDMLLTRRADKHDRVPDVLNFIKMQKFALDARSGECAALSEDAREPVKYFVRSLKLPQAGERDLAAAALAELGDRSALPALRAAANAETDKAVKSDIEQAIRRLEGNPP